MENLNEWMKNGRNALKITEIWLMEKTKPFSKKNLSLDFYKNCNNWKTWKIEANSTD